MKQPSLSVSRPSETRLKQFADDLDQLKQEVCNQRSTDQERIDLLLYCVVSFTLCTGGWILMGMGWSLWSGLGILALALGRFSRWILAHHVCHKGYDSIEGLPSFINSKRFGLGQTRLILWLDWMTPEAWTHEHNLRHHYRLNEPVADPDFVQEKSKWLINLPIPRLFKWMIILVGACVWKPLYYGPNTLIELYNDKKKPQNTPLRSIYSLTTWSPFKSLFWTFLWKSWLPYLCFNLCLIPFLYGWGGLLYLGSSELGWIVFQHALIAEILTNLHSFLVIVPNHSGSDLLQFSGKTKSKGEFYYRQITGSCNYQTGSWWGDFVQGYLNYQIEHHLWPSLTMRQYRQLQPHVKLLCQEYQIPYVQESLFKRVWMMMKVATGQERHLVSHSISSDLS